MRCSCEAVSKLSSRPGRAGSTPARRARCPEGWCRGRSCRFARASRTRRRDAAAEAPPPSRRPRSPAGRPKRPPAAGSEWSMSPWPRKAGSTAWRTDRQLLGVGVRPGGCLARRAYLVVFWVGLSALFWGLSQGMLGFSIRHAGEEAVASILGARADRTGLPGGQASPGDVHHHQQLQRRCALVASRPRDVSTSYRLDQATSQRPGAGGRTRPAALAGRDRRGARSVGGSP
jgi:hypothetical protein